MLSTQNSPTPFLITRFQNFKNCQLHQHLLYQRAKIQVNVVINKRATNFSARPPSDRTSEGEEPARSGKRPFQYRKIDNARRPVSEIICLALPHSPLYFPEWEGGVEKRQGGGNMCLQAEDTAAITRARSVKRSHVKDEGEGGRSRDLLHLLAGNWRSIGSSKNDPLAQRPKYKPEE